MPPGKSAFTPPQRERIDRALTAAQDETGLAFAVAVGPQADGAVDLSGIVKALGIQAAAAVLDAHGVHDYVLNAGGDVVVSGAQPDGRPAGLGHAGREGHSRSC